MSRKTYPAGAKITSCTQISCKQNDRRALKEVGRFSKTPGMVL